MFRPFVSRHFSRRRAPLCGKPRQLGHRTTLLVELLEDRTAPAVVDLFTAGASGMINGAKFEEVIATSSAGTGVFNSFVRLQASKNDFDGNENTEQGVNYDRAGGLTKQYDELNDPNSNRKLLLSDVPIVTVGGTDYREFFLDINQLNNRPYLSLDTLIVSVGNAGNLQQATPSSYNPTFGGNAFVAYDMDAGMVDGDSTVRLLSNSLLDNGSGKGDVRLLIPVANFNNSYATPFVYLFSKFGYTAPTNVDGQPGNEEFFANDGFEEWAVKAPDNAIVPKINIVKVTTYNGTEVDGQSIPEGAAIGWKYTVTNTGNVPLSSITVTDSVSGVNPAPVLSVGFNVGDANTNNILDVGESWIYTASGIAQSAHLGTYTNIGTATGVYIAVTVTAEDPSSYTPTNVNPMITVAKTVDANEDGIFNASESVQEGGVSGGTDATDQKVDYKFVITAASSNASTDPVTITSVIDDKLLDLTAAALAAYRIQTGNPTATAIVLAPGASLTFYVNDFVVPAQNAGTSHVNVVTVQGKDDENTPTNSPTAMATVNYVNVAPTIAVTKTPNPTSVSEGGVGSQSVTYTYQLTNTSPAGIHDPLSNVMLSDTDGTPTLQSKSGGDQDALLETGETWTYTLTVTVPTKNAGQSHTNTATASGTDDEGNTATNTAMATVNYNNVNPTINLVKTVDHPFVAAPGGMVTYTYALTNTSPAAAVDPLTITSLIDDKLGNLLMNPNVVLTKTGGDLDNLLEAGETWKYTLTTTVTGSANTTITNFATVTATDDDPGSTPATATDDATVTFIQPSVLTNTSYCSFDHDPMTGNQFRIIYIRDTSSTYRLNGTNPGQFYYNVFVSGTPGAAVNTTINIPYPFVTNGAVPIHVYNNYAIEMGQFGPCFTPIGDVTGSFTITTEGSSATTPRRTTPSGAHNILLSDYSVSDKSEWITVGGIIPNTGWMYVTVHLEYGLKATTGWSRNTLNDTATNTALGVTLTEVAPPQTYNFSYGPTGGGTTHTETGQSVNEFKRDAGVMGAVTAAATGSAKQGATVKFYGPSGNLIATDTADEDGFYKIDYKHTGSAATYTAKLFKGAAVYQTQKIQLKANGFAIVNFSVGSDYLQAADGATGDSASATLLTEDRLAEAVSQAFTYWADQGVAADQLQAVRDQLDAQIIDLAGSLLGQSSEEHTRIEIDLDAAGFGWDRVDLQRVVTHEIGHLLGFEDDHGDGIMGWMVEVDARLPGTADTTGNGRTPAGDALPFALGTVGAGTPAGDGRNGDSDSTALLLPDDDTVSPGVPLLFLPVDALSFALVGRVDAPAPDAPAEAAQDPDAAGGAAQDPMTFGNPAALDLLLREEESWEEFHSLTRLEAELPAE